MSPLAGIRRVQSEIIALRRVPTSDIKGLARGVLQRGHIGHLARPRSVMDACDATRAGRKDGGLSGELDVAFLLRHAALAAAGATSFVIRVRHGALKEANLIISGHPAPRPTKAPK